MKFRNFSFLIFCFLVLPSLVAAADFVSMVGIPGIPDNSTDLNQYFNAIYRLSISLAALLAVVKIVMAGAKYMLTDIVPAKGEALADIKGALLGLLVILAAVLILGTINKNIINTDLTFTEVATDPPPQPQLSDASTVQEVCDFYNSEGKTCDQDIVGNFCKNRELYDVQYGERDCKAFCESINGRTYNADPIVSWGDSVLACVHSPEDLNEYIINNSTNLNLENCPDGKICNYETCDSYNNDFFGGNCSSDCTVLGGIYGENTGPVYQRCAIPSDLYRPLVIVPKTNYTYTGSAYPKGIIGFKLESSINNKVYIQTNDGEIFIADCETISPSVCQ